MQTEHGRLVMPAIKIEPADETLAVVGIVDQRIRWWWSIDPVHRDQRTFPRQHGPDIARHGGTGELRESLGQGAGDIFTGLPAGADERRVVLRKIGIHAEGAHHFHRAGARDPGHPSIGIVAGCLQVLVIVAQEFFQLRRRL